MPARISPPARCSSTEAVWLFCLAPARTRCQPISGDGETPAPTGTTQAEPPAHSDSGASGTAPDPAPSSAGPSSTLSPEEGSPPDLTSRRSHRDSLVDHFSNLNLSPSSPPGQTSGTGPFTLPSTLPFPGRRPPIMAAQPTAYFYGSKKGKERAVVYVEKIELRIEREQLAADLAERAKNGDFRRNLTGPAEKWYWSLSEEIRGRAWADLKAAFLGEFGAAREETVSIVEFLETVQGVRQAGRPVAMYVRETEKVHKDCPEALHQMLGKQFLAGLDDRSKAREALGVRHGRRPRAVRSDVRRLCGTLPQLPSVVSAYVPVATVQPTGSVRVSAFYLPHPALYAGAYPPPYTADVYPMLPRDPGPTYQGYPKAAQGHEYRPRREDRRERREERREKDDRREPDKTFHPGIFCHNCLAEGHFSSSCEQPRVSPQQMASNRALWRWEVGKG
ncbi:hypothetical protein MMC07_008511 [Pseudocyphellaria aurata]|nr:hypothetical protein [Pseudocyphellaria aurata]